MSRFNSREEFEQWKAERALRPKQQASGSSPSAPDQADADAERTEKAIKLAWMAGAGIAMLTLIAVISTVSGLQVFDLTLWSLIDVALVLVLSFGVYRKNRTSSLLLLLYLVITRTFIWVQTGKPYGLVLTIILAYFFLQGIRGTFAHHASAAEADTGSSPWKPIAAALSIAALFVLLLFGEQAGLPVDLSFIYSGPPRAAAAGDWRPVVSPEGGFSIDMPGEPARGSKTIEVGGEIKPVSSYTLQLSKDTSYTVALMDAPESMAPEANAIETDLNGARDRLIGDAGGKLVSEQAVNLDNRTGREVQFENDRTAFRARLVEVNRRIYQIVAMAPKKLILSDDVNRFLSSFRPVVGDLRTVDDAPAVDTWLQFSPPGGRFSIEMPRLPVAGQESVRTSAGEMTLYRFDLDREEAGQKYTVQYADYPEQLMHLLRTADTVLNNASTVDVENIRGALVSEKVVSLGRYPGRELHIENADITMRIRLFFVERRLYKIAAVRPKQTGFSADDERFMTSFQLTP